jgi:protease-4
VRFLYSLFINLWFLLLWPLHRIVRARAAPRGAWLEVEIDGPVVEVARRLPFWDRRPRPLALQSLRKLVSVAADDARVAGLLVKVKRLHGASATATALRDVLVEARKRGKRVAVYLPTGAGTRELLVASAADQVLLGPETQVAPLGFALQAHYLKDALDRVGVAPEVLARGRYKSAGEVLERSSMSPEQREQLEAYLDVAWEVLIDALSAGRSVSRTLAEQWVNEGPWSARTAVVQGMADAVAFGSEVKRKLGPDREDGAPVIPARRYLRRRLPRWKPLRRPPHIAVIDVHGPIASGRSSGGVPMALADDLAEVIQRAADDRRVRGVVVHVDSPGGSALASHGIAHELRRLAEQKPVVAAFGDVAASGGYLVACSTHAIFAQPTTLTGSIGVVAARLVLAPLLERVGVGVEVVQRGARANLHSLAHPLDEGERAALERQLEDAYQAFLQVVAVGRKKDLTEVQPLAEGRIHSGRRAVDSGLVDGLGGFEAALRELRKRIGPDAEEMPARALAPRWLRLARPGLPNLGQALAHALGLPLLGDTAALVAAEPRERVWLWCPVAPRDVSEP